MREILPMRVQWWDVVGELIDYGITRPARKRQGYECNPAEAG
jgi:hypothetical protein